MVVITGIYGKSCDLQQPQSYSSLCMLHNLFHPLFQHHIQDLFVNSYLCPWQIMPDFYNPLAVDGRFITQDFD